MVQSRRLRLALAFCLVSGSGLADRPSRLAKAEAAVARGDARAAERLVRSTLGDRVDEESLLRARVVLEQAIRLRDGRQQAGPDLLPALSLLADVQLAERRFGDAEATFRRAIELTPDHTLFAAAFRSDLATALAGEGRLGEAITLQRLALAQAEEAVGTFDDVSLLPFVERLVALTGRRDPEEASLLEARLAALRARRAARRAEPAFGWPVLQAHEFRPDPWTLYQEREYQWATGIRP